MIHIISKVSTYLYLQGNGDATLDFFRDQFGFNGRETAAIMGAHTLGRWGGDQWEESVMSCDGLL